MTRCLMCLSARLRTSASLLLALLLLVCASAPAALAAGFSEGNALNNLTEGSEEAETTSTPKSAAKTSSEGESHTSGSVETIALAAGGVLLLGVAFVIVRDARRWAPAGEADVLEGVASRHSQAALRRRRAKAKAARKQRKRNR